MKTDWKPYVYTERKDTAVDVDFNQGVSYAVWKRR